MVHHPSQDLPDPSRPGASTPEPHRSTRGRRLDPAVEQVVRENELGEQIRISGFGGRWITGVGMCVGSVVLAVGMVVAAGVPISSVVPLPPSVILFVAVTFGLAWARKRRSERDILAFTHGLVLCRPDSPAGARWEAVRMRRISSTTKPDPDWSVSIPGRKWACRSPELGQEILRRRAAQFPRAAEVIRRGGEWNFCGWWISRTGVRLPSGAYRWDQVVVELDKQSAADKSFNPERSPRLLVRRRGDGLLIDGMQTEDAYGFFLMTGVRPGQ